MKGVYVVIKASTSLLLAEAVNAKIQEGYELIGGVARGGAHFYQAMKHK